MDADRFDRIAQVVGGASTRRQALTAVLVSIATLLANASHPQRGSVSAKRKRNGGAGRANNRRRGGLVSAEGKRPPPPPVGDVVPALPDGTISCARKQFDFKFDGSRFKGTRNITVDASFEKSLKKINDCANYADVDLVQGSTYRGVVTENWDIYGEVRWSNHVPGHAIDFESIDGCGWTTRDACARDRVADIAAGRIPTPPPDRSGKTPSVRDYYCPRGDGCLSKKLEDKSDPDKAYPPKVRKFIQCITDTPGLRWGGRFQSGDGFDPIHIDDGINEGNPARTKDYTPTFEELTTTYQERAQLAAYSQTTCPPGTICNETTGRCVPACNPPCGECEMCQDGQCVDDPDCCLQSCATCTTCENRQCVPVECGPCSECQDNACVRIDCGDCQECTDGACAPVDCGPCGYCEGNACFQDPDCCDPPCDDPCTTCVNGACTELDCGVCTHCEGGMCVPTDCGSCSFCENDTCVRDPECDCEPISCPPGQQQDPVTCQCECTGCRNQYDQCANAANANASACSAACGAADTECKAGCAGGGARRSRRGASGRAYVPPTDSEGGMDNERDCKQSCSESSDSCAEECQSIKNADLDACQTDYDACRAGCGAGRSPAREKGRRKSPRGNRHRPPARKRRHRAHAPAHHPRHAQHRLQ